MLENLGIALQITVIGMGLVFSAILLLWGILTVLVRLTADSSPVKSRTSETPVSDRDLKQRAAALAVAVALEQKTAKKTVPFALPRMQPISHWQAALRSRQIEQRGRLR